MIDLFGEAPKQPRAPSLTRMKPVEIADELGYREPGVPVGVKFSCHVCHRVTGWMFVTVTAAKRGIPCEHCNGDAK